MHSFGAASRLFRVGVAFAAHDLIIPSEYRDQVPPLARMIGNLLRSLAPKTNQSVGERLANALEKLGPAWIKLGQVLATRPDILGKEAAALSRLKDQIPPFGVRTARAVLRSEFGADAAHLFPQLSAPVAAASIAQVHKLNLSTGKALAIKVLRPDIETEVARDVAALSLAAHLTHTFSRTMRRLQPMKVVDVVAESLEREVDLRIEAAAADEFRALDAANGCFIAPKIDWSRSSKRVLATEWIDGISLSDHAKIDRLGLDRKLLAARVLNGFLHSALDHGYFHADMHEGNFLLRADGTLFAVDFGIMGRINATERRFLADVILGFIRRDYHRIAQVHFDIGYVPKKHSVTEFAQALRAVGEPIWGKTADQVSMGRLLMHLMDVTERFGMMLRPELVLLQKTMTQAEGMARSLDPMLDLWVVTRPVVETFMRRELGPKATIERTLTSLQDGLRAWARAPDTLARMEAQMAASDEVKAQKGSANWRPLLWLALGLVLGAALTVLVLHQNVAS